MREVPKDILQALAPVTGPALLHALAACGFSGTGYRALHDDLQAHRMSDDAAWAHYFRYGLHEQRCIPASARIGDYLPLLRLPIGDPALRRDLLAQFWTNQELAAGDDNDWDADIAAVGTALTDAGALPYVVLGDSHSHCYSKPIIHDGRLLAPIHLLCSGGSAIGLNNRRSRSGYGALILDLFRRLATQADQSATRFFFKFGQVDAEFVSVFRRIRQGEVTFALADFERFARLSVTQYEAFLRSVLDIFPHSDRIKVCGIFPPALADGIWRTGYVNAHIAFLETGQEVAALAEGVRKLEIPDLLTRTNMHALYNGLLQIMCARLGVVFVNDFAPLLSGAGVVDRTWTGEHEGHDHHLSPVALRPIIGELITRHATPRAMGTSPYSA